MLQNILIPAYIDVKFALYFVCLLSAAFFYSMADMLEEVFWEEINQTLEDLSFRSFYENGEWGEEFQTERSTIDEFISGSLE